jgi:hypothetical protein
MLEGYFSNKRTKIFFERTIKHTFLSLYIVQFVRSNNVLSKINYFQRTLIRKNDKNKKNSKERNSKEKNEFRKNVIRSNDLVPLGQVSFEHLTECLTSVNSKLQEIISILVDCLNA